MICVIFFLFLNSVFLFILFHNSSLIAKCPKCVFALFQLVCFADIIFPTSGSLWLVWHLMVCTFCFLFQNDCPTISWYPSSSRPTSSAWRWFWNQIRHFWKFSSGGLRFESLPIFMQINANYRWTLTCNGLIHFFFFKPCDAIKAICFQQKLYFEFWSFLGLW